MLEPDIAKTIITTEALSRTGGKCTLLIQFNNPRNVTLVHVFLQLIKNVDLDFVLLCL
jgi:hypothetical protein